MSMAKKDKVLSPKENLYSTLLDRMDKKFDMTAGDFSPAVLSTNVLSIDYVIGGGIRPGMITFSGLEGSAKSTLAIETCISAYKSKTDLIFYDDAENSLDGTYAQSIAGFNLFSKLTSDKTSDVASFYSSSSSFQKLYDSMVFLMKRLPDKVYHKETKQWYYRLQEGNKSEEALFKTLKSQCEYDDKMSKSKGKNYHYFKTDSSSPQGLFIIDSYPSLISDDILEKELSNNAVGLVARLFSQHLPRINGYIKRKSLVVLGVNQIREKPMVMYGPTQYEPGGNALKHYSNNRGVLTPRAVPEFWKSVKDKGGVYSEPSVEFENELDYYAFKHYKNTKNKYATPNRETWARVWVGDGYKPIARGRGFDKVFDTANFLELVNLAKITKHKGGIVIKFTPQQKFSLSGRQIDWLDFKALILYETAHKSLKTPLLEQNYKKALKKCGFKSDSAIRKECLAILNTLTSR
jgi:RecA/RadA recombinase